jgi:hypothetical protein
MPVTKEQILYQVPRTAKFMVIESRLVVLRLRGKENGVNTVSWAKNFSFER